ncbi:ABC transporter permease [Thermotalea metallivorans]|uniref:Oligopeptide transport system permease protein OppC n=1 Tax=Thermotalea metallivorans TaxID=520762 RepID=A0A140L7J8_9FIRM|nr:ABC transporter permease [Thermotalea metallivorans]KXG76523.1 Oligopeptide transport system permease protein OppC [Thermotalea metallivorans]
MTEMNKMAADMWQPVPMEERDKEKIVRPSMTYWQDAWRRLKQNKTAMLGLIVIIALFTVAIVGPWLSSITYSDQDLTKANQRPSAEHWFGTDGHGRDLYIRVLYGARISLLVAVVATIVNFFIGVLYGGIAGYAGGRVDNIMMRIVDIIYTVPLVLYAIILMVVIGTGLKSIIITLGTIYWVSMARIVRGQILSLKEQEYVLAARTLGASTWRILVRHLIPNAMGPIIVTATMMIPGAIFTESFLSFIGLGVSAPMASWGSLASDALGGLRSYPYQLFFPAAAICITMLAFNFLGDGLRDALDPRLRK